MSVSRHLVSVKIYDRKMGGLNIFESMSCISFIAFQNNYVTLYFARKSRIFQKQSGDALNLVASLFIPDYFFARFGKNICNHFNGRGFSVRTGNRHNRFGKSYSR